MTKKEVQDLLFRYRNGLCTPIECSAIESWFFQTEQKNKHQTDSYNIAEIESELRRRIIVQINAQKKPRSVYYYLSAAIAAAVILVYIFLSPELSPSTPPRIVNQRSGHANLTLANGQVIDLKTIKTGATIKSGNLQISKSHDNEITYHVLGEATTEGINTLSVPKGGKYKIILPDLSQVWINSDSKLSYPSAFSGNTRNVSLIGEAYFEVQQDKTKPFIVSTPKAKVRVLGTGFNINAYPNSDKELTSVTHGMVKVSSIDKSIVLKSNEQVEIDAKGNLISTIMDEKLTLAWKNDQFRFAGTKLKNIASQVERWYDVEVKLDTKIEDLDFYGIISRTESANQLFEILEETKTIKVEIKDKIIFVKPYDKKNN